jgi:hypothetical protein
MAYLAFAEGAAGAVTHAPMPKADPVPSREARLSALDWLAVAVARNDRLSSLRRPGRLAMALGSLFGMPRNPELADPRLEALRRVAVLSRHYGYTVPSGEVRRFLAAGFTSDQYELVVDSVIAERRPSNARSVRA